MTLCAPHGYGKTTLLAQWAHDTETCGVWIRAHDGIGDASGFVAELGAALRDFRLIEEDNPLWGALHEVTSDEEPWQAAAHGIRQMNEPLILVLDAAERLPDDVFELLNELIAHLPMLSLRLSTRRRPSELSAQLSPLGELDVIGLDELAFTSAELSQLLEDRTDLIDTVKAHGSIPGLVRPLTLVPHGPEPGDAVAGMVAAAVREGMRGWDPDRWDFTLRTSLAEVFDVELAEQLVPGADAAALLEFAVEDGMGTWTAVAHDPGKRRFSYMPFARAALEAYARERLSATDLRGIDDGIARWETAHDYPLQALRRSIRLADWDLVDAIVLRHWSQLLRSGEELRQLADSLPASAMQRRPVPAMLFAIAYNEHTLHRRRALSYFTLAFRGARRLRSSSASLQDRVLLRMIESAASRLLGSFTQAANSARAGMQLLDDVPLSEQEGWGHNQSTAYIQFGISLLYAGEIGLASECFERAATIQRPSRPHEALHAHALRAAAMTIGGDIRDAADVLADLGEPAGSVHGDRVGTLWHLARAYLHLERGDPAAALAEIAPVEETLPANEHWALLMRMRSLCLLLQGRVDEAATRLESRIRLHKKRVMYPPETAQRVRSTRELIALAQGDLTAANRVLDSSSPNAFTRISRGRIALAEGRAELALTELGSGPKIDEVEKLDGTSRVRAEHTALTVAALAAGGAEPAQVIAAYAKLDAFLADRGLLMPLILTPLNGLDAIARAADQAGALDSDARQRLARARELAPIRATRILPKLTKREIAVARELMNGKSAAQIAESFGVSPNTVKTHIRALYQKLGVHRLADARERLSTIDL